MVPVEYGELRVVVPVGFLLTETQEVTVSVARPGAAPLPVRLRLVPAAAASAGTPDVPVAVSAPTPLRIAWPKRAAFGGGDG
jgi:hypothetical protein